MLKNTWLLVQILAKSGELQTMASTGRKRKSRKNRAGLTSLFGARRGLTGASPALRSSAARGTSMLQTLLIYVLLMGYLGVLSFFYGYGNAEQVGVLVGPEFFPGMMIPMICILQALFGFFYVVSNFYHSPNNDILRSLPFRASEIILARFTVVWGGLQISTGALLYPALFAYGIALGYGAAYYVNLVLVCLFIPVSALLFPAVLSIILMRFTKFFRNKDRFTLISSLLMLVGMLGFLFGSGMFMNFNDGDARGFMLGSLQEGALDQRLQPANWIFFGAEFAKRSLAAGDVRASSLNLLFFLLAIAFCVALLAFVAKKFYFKGVMAGGQTPSKHRKLNSKERARLGRPTSVTAELLRKDIRLLLRSPVFLMNNVAASAIMPLIIIIMTFVGGGAAAKQLSGLPQMVAVFLDGPQRGEILRIVLMVFLAIVLYLGGTNMLAATSISREGRFAWLMNLLPVPFMKQLLVKLLIGFVMSIVSILIFLLPIALFLRLEWGIVLVALLIAFFGLLAVNLLGLICEMAWPRLEWQDEIQVAKQGKNGAIEMFGGLLLAGVGIGFLLLANALAPDSLSIQLVVAFLYLLSLNIAGFAFVRALIPRCKRRISVVN